MASQLSVRLVISYIHSSGKRCCPAERVLRICAVTVWTPLSPSIDICTASFHSQVWISAFSEIEKHEGGLPVVQTPSHSDVWIFPVTLFFQPESSLTHCGIDAECDLKVLMCVAAIWFCLF